MTVRFAADENFNRKIVTEPGVVMVPADLPIATVIDELKLVAEASLDGEWEGRVLYLPLR